MEESQSTKPDRLLAQEMRASNYEQFTSLVRMHLSFKLDLNTDEFDLPWHDVIYYEKGKVRKWNRLSKKIKGCTAGTRTHSPPEETVLTLTQDLISQLRVLKDFLMRCDNIVQEGIFRRTGAVSRQNELRSIMNQRKELNLAEGFTVHDCATVFKGCLSELPEPLLTDAHYPAHCQIADLCNECDKVNSKVKEEHLLHTLQLLLLLLPEENRILLEDVIDMLHKTIKYQSSNKMSADSLATLFTPHLICPRNLPAEALHYVSQNMSSVISYMIVKGQYIFDLPPKLATDIRAYLLEQKRKKTMSPEQILDESISDVSTVNTVYTFVDREKTAEAHNSNPTDTALAQLYAHIQSLPESSKKRKLIKQFNKENGQGTPLQFLMSNRLKNAGSGRSAKSIGGSIKKHIFQRSIMTRTPKKNILSTQCDTPNSAIIAPKARVLFQSPNPNSSSLSSILACKRHPLHKSISSSSVLTATVTSAASKEAPTLWNMQKPDWQLSNRRRSDLIEEKGKRVEGICFEPHRNQTQQYDKTDLIKKRKTLFKRKSETDVEITMPNRSELITCRQNRVRKSASLNDLDCSQDNVNVEHLANNFTCAKERIPNRFRFCVPISDKSSKMINIESENTPRAICTYRSKELITSTPSLFFGRKSMSPITKSTQRMPKSMQESIMTPRSRKPVMLATTTGLLDPSQPSYEGNLSSFREQDEDSFFSNNASTHVEGSIQYQSYGDDVLNNDTPNKTKCISASDSLTNTFREYLLGRSVLTASPVDTSFSSHSGDFGSTPDIRDLNESEINESLLYCLDGNQPNSSLSDASPNNELSTNALKIIEFDRPKRFCSKRSKSNKGLFSEKENNYPNEVAYMQPEKLLILEKNPNETSL